MIPSHETFMWPAFSVNMGTVYSGPMDRTDSERTEIICTHKKIKFVLIVLVPCGSQWQVFGLALKCSSYKYTNNNQTHPQEYKRLAKIKNNLQKSCIKLAIEICQCFTCSVISVDHAFIQDAGSDSTFTFLRYNKLYIST